MKKNAFYLIIVFLFFSCSKPVVVKHIADFNSDSAYSYVEKQVLFGPRVNGTSAHDSCAQYLADKLKQFGAHVIVQKGEAKQYDGKILNIKNIMGQYNPTAETRILLYAHWDTRPIADEDTINKNLPIPGANDGGSGVGVLLEIARQLQIKPANVGVDIVFFDAEDVGEPAEMKSTNYDSWSLGTQYWCMNPPIENYSADFGILLDMVGAKNAIFTQEGGSRHYASVVVDRVWMTADTLGFSKIFKKTLTAQIIDDHMFVNQLCDAPSIAIAGAEENSPNVFFRQWHTHQDNMEIIDKTTLNAVGKTVLTVVYNYNIE